MRKWLRNLPQLIRSKHYCIDFIPPCRQFKLTFSFLFLTHLNDSLVYKSKHEKKKDWLAPSWFKVNSFASTSFFSPSWIRAQRKMTSLSQAELKAGYGVYRFWKTAPLFFSRGFIKFFIRPIWIIRGGRSIMSLFRWRYFHQTRKCTQTRNPSACSA